MSLSTLNRQRRLVPLFLGGCLAVTACSAGGASAVGGTAGLIGRLEPLAQQCEGPIAGYVAIDASTTSRDETLLDERLDVVADLADAVVACTGQLRIVAFTGSATSIVTLVDADFPDAVGTLKSRLIRQGRQLESLADEVRSALATAEGELDGSGSDVLGQLTLIEQFKRQAGADSRLDARLLTDGVQTEGSEGLVVNSASFDEAVALDIAARVVVPSLTAQDRLAFIGLGRVSGEQPPTSYTRALTQFYGALCARTTAQCRAVTTFTKES